MKCPKCQYISFDSGGRCRNCGYDFSLALDRPPADLPIQDGSEPLGPLADFTLNTPNLPLFPAPPGSTGDPDAPLVSPGAAPRPPLAVRRGAPTTGRPRARRDSARTNVDPEPRLALDTAEIPVVAAPPASEAPAPSIESSTPVIESSALVVAPTGARLLAAAIDLLIVGTIDGAVVHFTLEICDLNASQVLSLPLAPLLSFLALLNGGYLSTFVAANGQTIGKMAARIRVVPADPAARPSEGVSLGHAIVRTAGYLVSLLPLGLGFLPALMGPDRRALHDRLADTRVVKA
jgi:uncharacterized RDD family membrane protein YckC